ncbi:glutamine--fructose-6-phosphate aminotransferase [isomerizing] 2-like [Camellia sinensis]|uniref:glutamine--fructose-6-phosphate aminotransferase [isomerizing] 2-like n=1 Tax=Camellia sinensis TaxID=4442 RepID=UPI001035A0ED|nr:glutamine--fructose-6-phosphate aminotransferase [isomerizing] 2-like [Camellia sinensis]
MEKELLELVKIHTDKNPVNMLTKVVLRDKLKVCRDIAEMDFQISKQQQCEADLYKEVQSVLLGGLKDHLRTIRRSRRIVFISCGTSYNVALAARPILEELSSIPVTMEVASDLLDRQGPIYREDTTVFVSQFGETADTLHALEYALETGALCIGITNTVGSAITTSTHFGVHINAGVEIDVASTKYRILSLSHFLCQQAYTSQIVVMPMLALAIGGNTISSQARKKAIIDGLFELPSKVRKVLKLDQEMKDLVKLLIAEQLLLVFGRGYNYATVTTSFRP